MSKRLLWGLILLLLWAMPVMGQYYFSDPNVAYQEALQRIEDARVSGATELDLSRLGLKDLPPEIGQLASLKTLYLWGNQLSILPPEIEHLTNLKELNLTWNHLTTLPPEIGQLTGLDTLELPHNQLTILPLEIGQLVNLRQLFLSSNQLTSLPPEIGQLITLHTLDIRDNLMATLPPQFGQLTRLDNLYIDALTFPPPEITSQGTAATLAYLRDYEAMQARQTIAGIASGVGGIVALILAFRWRQRRGLNEKKKRA